MNRIELYTLYFQIIERAEKLKITNPKREKILYLMDVELAYEKYNMKLKEWLDADYINFVHDFIGIQNHIDRIAHTFDDTFLPRFAS